MMLKAGYKANVVPVTAAEQLWDCRGGSPGGAEASVSRCQINPT